MKTQPHPPLSLLVTLAHRAFVFLFLCLCATLGAQQQPKVVKAHSVSAARPQGMAIHGDAAFLLGDFGTCRIFDLKNEKIIAEFDLASADPPNHANCASFGPEYPKGNNQFPALYISECAKPFRCFVESVGNAGPRLIQTLRLDSKKILFMANWYVDKENKFLWCIAMRTFEKDAEQNNTFSMIKLPLPPLGKKRVVFTEADIIEEFQIKYYNMTQGGCIRGDYLYLPVGVHDLLRGEHEKWRERAVIIVNLKTKKIERKINLHASIPNEPEDVDFHGDTMLMHCGNPGGIYRLLGI